MSISSGWVILGGSDSSSVSSELNVTLELVNSSLLHARVVFGEYSRVRAGDFLIQVVVFEEICFVIKDNFPPDMSVDRIKCFHPDFENRVRNELYSGPHALASLMLIGDPLGLLPKVLDHGAPFVCELPYGCVQEAFLNMGEGYRCHPSRDKAFHALFIFTPSVLLE